MESREPAGAPCRVLPKPADIIHLVPPWVIVTGRIPFTPWQPSLPGS